MKKRSTVNENKNREENSRTTFGLEWYLDKKINNLPAFYRTYRENAWKLFNEMPFPTEKDEPWRRTDITQLLSLKFQRYSANDQTPKSEINVGLLEEITGNYSGRIVIQDNVSEVILDNELEKSGIIFSTLKNALCKYPTIVQKILGKIVFPGDGKFSALTSAFEENGIFLYIPRNINVSLPLNGVIRRTDGNYAQIMHNILWLAEGASVTFINEIKSINDNHEDGFYTGVTEILVEKDANLTFIELQDLSENVWNFTHERAKVLSNGNINWFYGALGSRLSKNFIDVDLVEKGASTQMSGIYFTDNSQHIDLDTQQNHLAPYTKSNLMYKGVLQNEGVAIWQGMIFVGSGAQKTDGYQANRNLILNRNARIESIPGLEILADDVRCTHGATVGKVDEDQIFYLESRGIPENEAVKMIVSGFFEPLLEKIPIDGIRNQVRTIINQKIQSKIVS